MKKNSSLQLQNQDYSPTVFARRKFKEIINININIHRFNIVTFADLRMNTQAAPAAVTSHVNPVPTIREEYSTLDETSNPKENTGYLKDTVLVVMNHEASIG